MSVNLESIISKIVETVDTKTVVGDPMEIGGLTLIPVMNAYFGFGGGGGEGGNASKDQGSGSGGGGGARLKVTGMLVLKDGDISFLPTGKGGAIDKILDSIPDLIDKVKIKLGNEDGNAD